MKINNRPKMARIYLVLFIIILFGVVTLGGISSLMVKKEFTGRDFKSQTVSLSKAQIVKQINQIMAEINSYERKNGVPVHGRFHEKSYNIYAPRETAHLIGLYQSIITRVHYLKTGKIDSDLEQWEGFHLKKAGEPYTEGQIMEVLLRLEELKIPEAFLNEYRIFLLPYSISDISGLGGAGFTMLSPPGNRENLAEDLTVTLYHEIGHHIHLSFMPRETVKGKEKWNEYLQLRGGTWHEPGKVNTAGWSESSEETFAEDFRMLFDKSQPFFGDISLGDPRNDSGQAQRLKNFISGLAREKSRIKYHSPWTPLQDRYLSFWLHQEPVILSFWSVFGIINLIMFYGYFFVDRSIYRVY